MKRDTAQTALRTFEYDKSRLLDIALFIQDREGYIPPDAILILASALGLSVADVERTISFYHFLSTEPRGEYTIYLNDSVVSVMMGQREVAKAFEEAVGCRFGEVTADGGIGLFYTPCIGMSDQEPAALINNVVFPALTPYRAKEIIRDIRAGLPLQEIQRTTFGDGKNAHPLMQTTVRNHIRRVGPLLDPDYEPGQVIEAKLKQMTPNDVLDEVRGSELRGRGGAGFPTGLKWTFCREADNDEKYVFCNADEGEPGTFKDRVILTEKPEMVIEGMIIAGYAVGAQEGIIYLRHEYKYMEAYLEAILQEHRDKGYLGEEACGLKGFNYDIRIQFGAGSYVCGEESALLESAEGKRGEPRPRPPFPVEAGYRGCPTIVNNVETLCAVVNILLNGHQWYLAQGTEASRGTKVLSISGDCQYPGVYELEWGFSVNDILEITGARNTQAVQMGGPSGSLIGKDQFDHIICYADLATGGSLIIFNETRDLIRDVVLNFTDFFIDESCGSCVPCRTVPTLMRQRLVRLLEGKGTKIDIRQLEEWTKIMPMNRCGLGHTAANPIHSLLKNFRHLLEERINKELDFEPELDEAMAVKEFCDYVNREPNLKPVL